MPTCEHDKLIFNSRDELLRVRIDRIVYFEADGNYTYAMSQNKLKGVLGMSLTKVEEVLIHQIGIHVRHFMRLGKRFIINTEFVYSIQPAKQRLILSDQSSFAFSLPVSKEALKRMKELLTKK